MSAIPVTDEFCTSCGDWVPPALYNYDTGWCNSCVGLSGSPVCPRCGGPLDPTHGRTTCDDCRQEVWLQRHVDDLEFLVVVKGYSISRAREVIIVMVRPICRYCNKPIKGGREGALFHKGKEHRACSQAGRRYRRLLLQGLTRAQALDRLAPPREDNDNHTITLRPAASATTGVGRGEVPYEGMAGT